MTRPSTAEVILDAARRLVARNGTHRLTLSALADEAGVSRPTVYRWFVSREAVLGALAGYAVDRFDEGLRSVVETDKPATQRLEDALRYIFRYIEDTDGPLAIRADVEFFLQTLADTMRSHVDLLADLLGDALGAIPAVASGELRKTDVAATILRMAYSYYLIPHEDVEELIRTFLALLMAKADPHRKGTDDETSAAASIMGDPRSPGFSESGHQRQSSTAVVLFSEPRPN